MAPNISKLINRNHVLSAAGFSVVIWALIQRNRGKRNKKFAPEDEIQYMITDKNEKKVKAHVNKQFLRNLRKILSVAIPGWASKESGLLLLVAASLVARSLCDLWMIQNGTKIESAIVAMNSELFKRRLFKFFAAMPLVSIVNNILKWSIGELKLRLRTNLTHSLYNDYLKSYTYYRMSNIDNRIANADQLLTTDVDKFCESITDLYSNIAKPILDISIYVYRLTATIGGRTPAMMLGYLFISGVILTHLRRPTGSMTVTEQKLEGQFRHINSRLITNSEEVAFYQGNKREHLTLMASFNKLVNHLRRFLEFKVCMGVVDNIVAKYIATVVGFYAVSIPFLTEGHPITAMENHERFRLYYTYGRMLVKLAEAIGRLVLAGRELTRLAGFTTRVTEIRVVLKDLNEGKYQRTMLTANSNEIALKPNSGKTVIADNVIRFDKVPLVTPNGDILVKELTFEVRSGQNVLVCGPNGCGKSSLFRILGELWPLFGGTLTKPPRGKLFYIPQRPYMTLGTLRDQLIYPHTHSDMKQHGITDDKLMDYLGRVQLSYLVDREDGLNAVADWLDVLSGGEKQRVAMARLFYHSPQFAILDECTSAVSVDVEGSMYQYCREVGITLFTVSHRRSLWIHHEYFLQFDGHGGFKFERIDSNTEQFGS